jgi:hypothetical protein
VDSALSCGWHRDCERLERDFKGGVRSVFQSEGGDVDGSISFRDCSLLGETEYEGGFVESGGGLFWCLSFVVGGTRVKGWG